MWRKSTIAAAIALTLISPLSGLAAERYNLGRPVSTADITAWNIDVSGDGTGLPAGRGSVAEGRGLFAEVCSACHGDKGQGDYVNRAMPFNAPQSLTPDQVYAVTAYLLFLNGIVPEDTTLDAASLRKIEMPNRNGFTTDPRPDISRK